MEDYTVYLYETEKNKYTELGNINASCSKDAIKKWKASSGWKPEKDLHVLFAKPPLCR